MNEVINEMLKRREQRYPVSIAQEFINKREYYETFIIVEGSSDKNFYKNTNINIFNNKEKTYYIFEIPNKEELYNKKRKNVGKKAVIEAYFRIREWSRNCCCNNSVIFIVDKDFFGINWKAKAYREFAEKMQAKPEDIANFTILDCHSHECYFIENINLIFKLLGIEDKIEQFNKILDENLDEISNYFAYKSILEDENPKLSYVGYQYDNMENIEGIDFNFEIKDGKLKFNRDDMLKGIEKMKKTIESSHNRENLENQHLEMKQKFKNHPELLRGHTLYELLECYLKYYGKSLKNYKEYNDEIIKEMEIPLNIKILKFGFGGYKLDKT